MAPPVIFFKYKSLRRFKPFLLVLSRQIYFSGVQSAFVVALLAVLIGAGFILAFQAVLFIDITLQALELLATLVSRSLGVLLPLLIFCARSITAIASELSLMSVTGEIRTLRRLAVSPTLYLFFPRILGAAISGAILYLEFLIASLFAGGLAAGGGFDAIVLLQVLDAIGPVEILYGLIRSAAYSAAAVMWVIFCVARGCSSLPDVSRAVSAAVLQSIALILSLDVVGQLLVYAISVD